MAYGYLPGSVYGVLGFNRSALPEGGGMQLGQILLLQGLNDTGDWKEVMLVQAGENIGANDAVTFSDDDPFTVIRADADTELCAGVNDMTGTVPGTGAAVTSGNYFFMSIRGIVEPNVNNGINANVFVTSSAVDGELDTSGAGFSNVSTLAASGAGGPTRCFKIG